MSQGPRRHLRLETIDGVTVVSFVDTKIETTVKTTQSVE